MYCLGGLCFNLVGPYYESEWGKRKRKRSQDSFRYIISVSQTAVRVSNQNNLTSFASPEISYRF